MVDFAEVRLDVGTPLGRGGYGFATTVTRNQHDFEKRSARRLEPLFKGNLGECLLTGDMLTRVQAFFNARRGKQQGFRYKFWADYKATNRVLNLGDTASTQGVLRWVASESKFAFYKKYVWAGVTCYKRITKLVEGTVNVYSNINNDVTSSVLIDHNLGWVDPSATGLNGNNSLTWDGEFDLPVRFDADNAPRALEAMQKDGCPLLDEQQQPLYRMDSLPLVELAADSPLFPPPPPASIDRVLDLGIPRSAGSENFLSVVVPAGSGFEKVFGRRGNPLFEGDFGELILEGAEIDYFVCVFNVLRGRLTRFRWRNWADYQVTEELTDVGGASVQGVTIPNVGNATNTKFQLAKLYDSYSSAIIKPIYKPVEPALFLDDAPLTSGYTIDSNGLVTMAAPIDGSVLTWRGEHDIPIRLDDDAWVGSFRLLESSSLWGENDSLLQIGGIAIVETEVGLFLGAEARNYRVTIKVLNPLSVYNCGFRSNTINGGFNPVPEPILPEEIGLITTRNAVGPIGPIVDTTRLESTYGWTRGNPNTGDPICIANNAWTNDGEWILYHKGGTEELIRIGTNSMAYSGKMQVEIINVEEI